MIGASSTTHRPRGADRRAFTAMELLVATLVLGMMVTMAAMMLASSRRLVSGAQAKMRANSIAAAVADLIRRDLHRASKAGFLSITAGTSPKLVLAIPGNAMSIDSNVRGDGEVICYGLEPNSGPGGGSDNWILYRTRWVLKKNEDGQAGGVDVWTDDNWIDIISDANSGEVSATAQRFILRSPSPGQLSIPPSGMKGILDLWQAVAAYCSDLTIEFATDTHPDSQNLDWKAIGGTWTYLNPNDWPRAIRVKFKMIDPSMPEDSTNVYYEVVCPLGL